jgi:hypothetical protein
MILTTVQRMERLRSSNTSGPFDQMQGKTNGISGRRAILHDPGRFEMSEFSDSYVSRVLFATLPPTCAADAVARRWRWLRASVYDPYRPELHYMRGPGPKWREKHARSAGC